MKALITCKINSDFSGVIFTRKYNKDLAYLKKYCQCLQKSMIGQMGKFTNA